MQKQRPGQCHSKGSILESSDRPWIVKDLQELARKHCPEASRTLAAIMRDPNISAATRAAAAGRLMDRGYGRAITHLQAQVRACVDPSSLGRPELKRRFSAVPMQVEAMKPIEEQGADPARSKLNPEIEQRFDAHSRAPVRSQPLVKLTRERTAHTLTAISARRVDADL
jgi:hypothetical protein